MGSGPDIHIIVAMSAEMLIGSDGKLPWNLPDDLKIFRELTLGNSVIMGRRTYESIGHPLENRNNIVISSRLPDAENIEVFSSFKKGLKRAEALGRDVFCIGGREIYQAALPVASQLHISWVQGNFSGDIFFPDFNGETWQELEKTVYKDFIHISYQRKQ